jgi:hypothetical protein
MYTAVFIGCGPATLPPPSRIWTRIRGRYWSARIDDISVFIGQVRRFFPKFFYLSAHYSLCRLILTFFCLVLKSQRLISAFCELEKPLPCVNDSEELNMKNFQTTQYTQSGKISPAWWGEGARPPPFTISTITYKVAVYAPVERAGTLPVFHLYPTCTLCFKHRRLNIYY